MVVHQAQGMTAPVIPTHHSLQHDQKGRTLCFIGIEALPRRSVAGVVRYGSEVSEAQRARQGYSRAAAY